MKRLDNEKYMREAIKTAQRGIKKGQTPFGAVIVDKKTGKIISKAHNCVIKKNDASAHAEIEAIRKAGKKLKKFKFKDLIIYSTCEPCPMCFSAIHWSGIKEVYFGAKIKDSKKLGFDEIMISNEEMKKFSKGSIKIRVKEGVLKEECIEMMMEWKSKKKKAPY